MTMLLEASEEGVDGSWDGGKIVWSVRYTLEGEQENDSQLMDIADQQRMQQRQLQHHYHHHVEKRKLQARLEIQKDDIQAVLPISKVIQILLKIKLSSGVYICRHIAFYFHLRYYNS